MKRKIKMSFKRDGKPPSLDGYRYGRTLGQGSYGKVVLGEHTLTGKQVAVRVIQKELV
jgi:serine/threonine protein kinase